MLETYIEFLEQSYYEMKFAFDGLADANVWKIPAPGVPSIGQIAGHVAFWYAARLTGKDGEPLPDPVDCRVKSILIDRRFGYYPYAPPSTEQQSMASTEIYAELLRIHRESVDYLKSITLDLDGCASGWSPPWTYRATLKYAVFHVDYHTGQIYTIRQLFGENPPDN